MTGVESATTEHDSASTFVGREDAIRDVQRLLRVHRVVTLTGPAGSGKTRLAQEIYRAFCGASAEGAGRRGAARRPLGTAWFVELAPLAAGTSVVPVVAAALGLTDGGAADWHVDAAREGRAEHGVPDRALAEVGRRLAEKVGEQRALLVLDNCEHVTASVAELVGAVSAARGVRILVTSRQPLGVPAERLYAVSPLAVPGENLGEGDNPEALASLGAVRLFCERAARAQPGFALTSQNAAAVAAICRQVDGLPLAIELAAARVGLLTAQQIAARLTTWSPLLSGGPQGRHESVRTAIDWSHALLERDEQLVFRRLAVFSGGWTAGAAALVCGGGDIPAAEIPRVLASLTARSLVQVERTDTGTRYRLLELVRDYAAAQLDAAGEGTAFRRRHALWCVTLVRRAGAGLGGPAESECQALLGSEMGNCRAALHWLLEGDGRALPDAAALAQRLCGTLWRHWAIRGLAGEGRRWLDRALAAPGHVPAHVRARAINGAGNLAHAVGDFGRGLELHQEGLAVARAAGNRRATAIALNAIGLCAQGLGDLDHAEAMYAEAAALGHEADEAQRVAVPLHNAAKVALERGDTVRAAALFTRALALVEHEGPTLYRAKVERELGALALTHGQPQEARTRLEWSLRCYRQHGDVRGEGATLLGIARVRRSVKRHRPALVAAARGLRLLHACQDARAVAEALAEVGIGAGACWRLADGVRLLAAAEALRSAHAYRFPDETVREAAMTIERAHITLGAGGVAALWAAGLSLTLDAAVELSSQLEERIQQGGGGAGAGASTMSPVDAGSASPPAALSERQWEVARLVAKGWRNREIAAALGLSVPTVATHVREILKRLSVRSRAGVAALLARQVSEVSTRG